MCVYWGGGGGGGGGAGMQVDKTLVMQPSNVDANTSDSHKRHMHYI